MKKLITLMLLVGISGSLTAQSKVKERDVVGEWELVIDIDRREIEEEIGVTNPRIGDILYSTSVYLDQRDMWMTWIVYKAQIDSSNFIFGDGVTDAKYITIEEIRDSNNLLEKLIVETVHAVT